MKLFLFFCVIFYCECNEDNREAKFFFGEKAQTVISYRKIPEFVTEYVPSSCIVMEPTLPPCRHVRNLEIYPSVPTRITKTQTPQLNKPQKIRDNTWNSGPQPSEPVHHSVTPPLNLRPQHIKTHSPFWNWNVFNPFRGPNVTHTSTKTIFVTTVVEDPHTVVSFYVRGCRPSRLPFNLPECNVPEVVPVQAEVVPMQQEKNIVVMAPLKFVSSVGTEIIPTKSVEKVDEKKAEEKNKKEEEIIQEKPKK